MLLLSCDRCHRLSVRLRAHNHGRSLCVVLRLLHPLLLVRHVMLLVARLICLLLPPRLRRVVICSGVLVVVVWRDRLVLRMLLRIRHKVSPLRVQREGRRRVGAMPSLVCVVVHIKHVVQPCWKRRPEVVVRPSLRARACIGRHGCAWSTVRARNAIQAVRGRAEVLLKALRIPHEAADQMRSDQERRSRW